MNFVINNLNRDRINYSVSIARGVGIISVVWAHIFYGPVHDFIYKFHMPLFFIISGFLAEYYGKNVLTLKSIYKYLQPVIFSVTLITFLQFPVLKLSDWKTFGIETFFLRGYESYFGRPGFGGVFSAYWFIFSLIAIRFLFGILSTLNNFWAFVLSLFFGLLVAKLGGSLFFLPKTVLAAFYCLQFYAFGCVFGKIKIALNAVIIYLLIILGFSFFVPSATLDISAKNFGLPIFSALFAIAISSVILCFGYIVSNFKSKLFNSIKYIGDNSFAILLYHQAIHLFIENKFFWLDGWVVFFVSLLGPLVLAHVAIRCGVGKVLFGGR